MWWSSGSSKNAVQETVSKSSGTLPLPESVEKQATPVKQELSREEQASLELAEFLKEIEIEQSQGPQRSLQSKSDAKAEFSIPANISPDALYPKDMNCRSAFDYAMFCQSFGGQWVNVYRYGEFRSCSNHWTDFWMCMRTRNWDQQDKTKAIQDHYRKKAVKWKTGPSSEDIWEVRTEPVKDAFQESLEDLEAKIEEWKRANPNAPDPWDSRNKHSTSSA